MPTTTKSKLGTSLKRFPFFLFLVLAPVGLTEFARESKDQAGLQVQHEAQQQEIDALKAQIAILMKQAERT